MTRKQRRLTLIGSGLGVLAIAVALMLSALRESIVFFNSPTDIADGNRDIPVNYRGIVPDLFREGQGVVAEGHIEPGGTFQADTVLAKHDENYMPREIVETLKKQGHWQESAAPNVVAVKAAK
jgi:cytochrome c-type biogenesis protein CcmE